MVEVLLVLSAALNGIGLSSGCSSSLTTAFTAETFTTPLMLSAAEDGAVDGRCWSCLSCCTETLCCFCFAGGRGRCSSVRVLVVAITMLSLAGPGMEWLNNRHHAHATSNYIRCNTHMALRGSYDHVHAHICWRQYTACTTLHAHI